MGDSLPINPAQLVGVDPDPLGDVKRIEPGLATKSGCHIFQSMQEHVVERGLVPALTDGFGQQPAPGLAHDILRRGRPATLVRGYREGKLDYPPVVERMPSLKARERAFAFIQFGEANQDTK